MADRIKYLYMFSIFIVLGGFLWSDTQQVLPNAQASKLQMQLGVEVFSPVMLYRIVGKKAPIALGLVTNQTGIDQAGTRTIDILRSKGFCIKRIFAPEHGIQGSIAAEKEVSDTVDNRTRIPIISLFGKGTGKAISERFVKDLDLVIFDMQDSGMRHYTYISTLFSVLQAAARCNKPLIIFDRPNPLKHSMEGPLVEPTLISFISVAPIPLRHGMTIGELATYFNTHVLEKPANLHVVKMRNYNREIGLSGELAAPLSPSIKNKDACYGYSFLGLLGEVRPFDTGLGTEYAFCCLALPEWMRFSDTQWQELSEKLKKLGVNSVPLRYKSPRKKKWCKGLRFVFSDRTHFSSSEVLLMILRFFHKAGITLTFSDFFDKAAGTAKVRKYVQGNISRPILARDTNAQLKVFFEKAKKSFLYIPAPKIVFCKRKNCKRLYFTNKFFIALTMAMVTSLSLVSTQPINAVIYSQGVVLTGSAACDSCFGYGFVGASDWACVIATDFCLFGMSDLSD